MHDGEIPVTILAATVVVLRDRPGGLESLLLRRHSGLGFGGGMWVFPGGRVDEVDHDPAGEEATARRAAAREAAEEAGLVVDPEALVPFAHWTPPSGQERRFATWFFLAEAPDTVVEVDGGEIVDHLWARPTDALARHATGEIELMPPTFQTLSVLGPRTSVADALAAAAAEPVPRFATRLATLEGVGVCLWEGDAGYQTWDATVEGRRDRLIMGPLPWRYERS
jgi:8-oxo-dGTP pyrophosphatase MutT (NUDIX family)